MHEVEIAVRSMDRFETLVGAEAVSRLRQRADALRKQLGPRVIWNINSAERGGGVAELLRPLIGYSRGLDWDVRWLVLHGTPEFFRFTKRLHHALHGSAGDGTSIADPALHRIYDQVLHDNAAEVEDRIRPGDLVVLHDPQTLGMAPLLRKMGARLLWRCHVGSDQHNAEAEHAWTFLLPYLREVEQLVFSRSAYVPPQIPSGRYRIIPPTVDPFSAKNDIMPKGVAQAILAHVGLLAFSQATHGDPVFHRDDGTRARVDRCADVIRLGPASAPDIPLVVQVSRWDPLKDPKGLIRGFCALLDPSAPHNAELLLAGPTVHAVADDPEAASVFEDTLRYWRSLPHHQRTKVHLANLPMADLEENAAIVNALQRHARVIVQKSLREGFGLTVTEAMWKGRPVIASNVGGMRDQIENGKTGLLLDDPSDEEEFARTLERLLMDEALSSRLGEAAHLRVRENFLSLHALQRFADLLPAFL